MGSSAGTMGYTSRAAAYADANEKTGGLAIVRTFSGGGIGTWGSGDVATVTNNYNATVWHSFKTWDEPAISAWIAGKPDNGQTAFLTFFHEPENDGLSAAQILEWKSRQARMKELAVASGRTDVKVGSVLMEWTINPNSSRNFWRDWYVGPPVPGKTAAGYPTDYPLLDFYGWDAYNTGDDAGVYRDPVLILARLKAIADAAGASWAIGEFGSRRLPTDPNDTGRRDWIADYFAACAADGRCLAACYWSSQVSVGGWDGRIFNSPEAWKGMLEACATSRDHYGITYPKV